jgi:antitoxin HigA-1
MEMFNPPHPGEILREDCIAPAGLTVTEAAVRLGVSRQSMSELVNGRNGISADMALRLEKAGWGPALSWLRNQVSYDLWQARQRDEALDERPSPRMRLRAHRKNAVGERTGHEIRRLKRRPMTDDDRLGLEEEREASSRKTVHAAAKKRTIKKTTAKRFHRPAKSRA